MAEPAELSCLEFLGHRLAPATFVSADLDTGPIWHRVQIRRAQGIETIDLDGKTLVVSPHRPPLASWITIRPFPDKPTRIRNLTLE
jgi:hypothetical protein